MTEPQTTEQQTTEQQLSLATAAARNLTTTTKSTPQMQAISPRWLLRMLPWVEAKGGAYRVNRRLTYAVGDGIVSFTAVGNEVRVIPPDLCELPMLRGFDDADVLAALADRFVQREFAAGDTIVESGQPADQLVLIAHGKVNKLGTGPYGDRSTLGVLADGEYFGEQLLTGSQDDWDFTITAATRCTVLALSRGSLQQVLDQSEALRTHIQQVQTAPRPAQNKQGEAAIELASGHTGEPELPGTFVDYESSPREYELSVAQTVLRIHSRVADLYNDPMNQIEQQLRLTIAALRERQEYELINNHDFGLLYNADRKQRINTRTGPPTPDDLDELLSRRRKSRFFLAHPRTITAFGRECSRRGVYPQRTDVDGRAITTWRGVPIFPCNKIPITRTGTSAVLVLRTGVADEGVIGLQQTGIPFEYEPGLNVRFMGLDTHGIISYLVSTYYSAAVLVPDALGILENVEITR